MARASARMFEKMFDLSGKVSIVTGGNRGIGRGLALGLAEAGAAVAILARDEEKSQATLKELLALGVPAIALRVDLKQRRELKPAFDEVERKLGPVDIMVNNAAYATLTSVVDTTRGGLGRRARGQPQRRVPVLQVRRAIDDQARQRAARLSTSPAWPRRSAAESFRPTRSPRAGLRSSRVRSRSNLGRIISRSTRWRPDGSRPT